MSSRSFKQLFTDITKKPPILFPLVGLFHVFMLLWTVWDDRHAPFPGMEWIQAAWMIAYTIFWFAACDLRKWGAIGYILLTVIDVSIYLAVRNGHMSILYLSNMMILDGIFSFFLLFFFKRFE